MFSICNIALHPDTLGRIYLLFRVCQHMQRTAAKQRNVDCKKKNRNECEWKRNRAKAHFINGWRQHKWYRVNTFNGYRYWMSGVFGLCGANWLHPLEIHFFYYRRFTVILYAMTFIHITKAQSTYLTPHHNREEKHCIWQNEEKVSRTKTTIVFFRCKIRIWIIIKLPFIFFYLHTLLVHQEKFENSQPTFKKKPDASDAISLSLIKK